MAIVGAIVDTVLKAGLFDWLVAWSLGFGTLE